MPRRHRDPGPLLEARPRLHGLALRVSRGGRDLLSPDEVCAVADLAMVRAWRRWEAASGPFGGFAWPWVRGAVLRALADEIRLRRARGPGAPPGVGWAPPDQAAEARRMLRRVGRRGRRLLLQHVVFGAPLAHVAQREGRSRSQVSRRYAEALTRVRRRAGVPLTGTSGSAR